MDFNELHETIPYVIGKKKHVVTMRPYPDVQLAFPGKHQQDTDLKGGDFLIRVTCKEIEWNNHPFTHQDIFDDVQKKYDLNPTAADTFLTEYAKVVFGSDPTEYTAPVVKEWKGTLNPKTFLHAAQCLAVAEHRRYARFETSHVGGRYLPLRFVSGIVSGSWTAESASTVQRKGRPGLELMEKLYNFDTKQDILHRSQEA